MQLPRLVAARFDVQRVALTSNPISRGGVVVALVSTGVLFSTVRLRTEATNRKTLQSRFDRSHVMRVGDRHRDGLPDAAFIRKKETLGHGFVSIRI